MEVGIQCIAHKKYNHGKANAVSEALTTKVAKLQKKLTDANKKAEPGGAASSWKRSDVNKPHSKSEYGEWTLGLTIDPKWSYPQKMIQKERLC